MSDTTSLAGNKVDDLLSQQSNTITKNCLLSPESESTDPFVALVKNKPERFDVQM